MRNKALNLLLMAVLLSSCQLNPVEQTAEVYCVDSIVMPEGLTAEVSALDFLADGRLVAGFMRGEILLYDPSTDAWEVFATGLHEPLGIRVISPAEMLVMQLPELTLLKDTDGDGKADVYQTVFDDFGMTGNYHEFAYGPVKDQDGNTYIALNAASSGGGISQETRGDTLMIGKSETSRAMFSVVPYRGWVLQIDSSGQMTPFASGLRSPNGMVVDQENRLFVTENQGDWVGSSALYHIQKDKFYGHPSSLVWTEGWDRGNPFDLTTAQLDAMREAPAVIFPHDILANSPSQPVMIQEHPALDVFEGQMLVGEMGSERLVRVQLESVNGVMQGAATTFIDGSGLRKGNNRLVFAPNGDLWVGQADHGWLGDRGIQRISFTGRVPFDIQHISLQKDGFDIELTKPLSYHDSLWTDSTLHVQRYRYAYHEKYGSPQIDLEDLEVKVSDVSSDRRRLKLVLDDLKSGFVYQVTLNGLISTDGQDTLDHKAVFYTVKELR